MCDVKRLGVGDLADVIWLGQCTVCVQSQYCAIPLAYAVNLPAGTMRPEATFVNYLYVSTICTIQ